MRDIVTHEFPWSVAKATIKSHGGEQHTIAVVRSASPIEEEMNFLREIQARWGELHRKLKTEGFAGFRYISPQEFISPIVKFRIQPDQPTP